MAAYEYREDFGNAIHFDPDTGELLASDHHEGFSGFLPRGEAINLASKLLQWGTSS